MGGRVEPMDVFFHKQHAWASSDSWCVPPRSTRESRPRVTWLTILYNDWYPIDSSINPIKTSMFIHFEWISSMSICAFSWNTWHHNTQQRIDSINCRLGSCIVSIPGYSRSSDLWAPLRVHTCGQAKGKESGLARMTSHYQQQHLLPAAAILFGLIVMCLPVSSSSSSCSLSPLASSSSSTIS